ncbi:MAG: hypothetical protein WAO00_03140 [Chthoniobacterales bacterium]
MRKTSASRSAFLNPPVLITCCATGAFLALIAFALHLGATARGAQVSQQNQQGGQAGVIASGEARLASTPLGAQTTFQVKITTTTSVDERVTSVDRTCDGGYILAAGRYSSTLGSECYVVKLRADGDVEWDRTLARPFQAGVLGLGAFAVKQISDGGFIIVGELDLDGTGALDMGIYLAKLDFAGDLLWARVLPGTSHSGSQGRSGVDEMSDGGFIINAHLQNTVHAQEAPLLLRTDRFGVLQWAQSYNDNRYGVNTFARFNDVKVAHDGNLIACGNTALYVSGQRQTLLVKTDPAGNILWSHTYDLPGYDVAFGLDTAANGDFLIVGTKTIGEVGATFVLRTDPLGNVVWYKTFRGFAAQLCSIRETPTGDLVIGGTRTDLVNWDASLLKLNSSGAFQWCKSYSGSSLQDDFAAVVPALDGGYLLAGATDFPGGSETYADLYAVKTDAAGNSGCNERDYFPILGTDLPPLLNVPLNAFAILEQAALPLQITAANSQETVLCRQVGLPPDVCCAATFSENFDRVTSPNLPGGWTATNDPPGDALWVISPIDFSSFPNDAFVDDQDSVSDKRLDSPGILITSATAQLCFRNNFNTEYDPPPAEVFWDGGVLEVSSPNIIGGTFTDITDPAVGGIFVSGGYTGEIDGTASNPLAGRPAWSGNSGGYIKTVINLPASFNGQTIKLRFRMGTDRLVAAPGWRIDTIKIASVASGCCGGAGRTRLDNVSTRLRVQTGDNIGIGGFIITGSAPKHVLLRAIGPSLSGLGVPGALQDPVMELHGPGAFVTITNNNWRETQEAAILATGIPPTDNRESAIDATLVPGAYTAVVTGNGNTAGVALIEVYDLEPEALSKLANISTRAFVGTGDNLVIAGFILGSGDGDSRIVVRGVGPSLTAFGVPNALANPTLELRDGNGALLIANNDWQDDPVQAAELTAAGLAPTSGLESAVAMTLPPGLYTALLRGLNNGTGVGLVEVYDRGAP